MKPSAFAYERPTSLAGVLEALARGGDGAALLAGGQSLVPALNRRHRRPATVVDLARVPELAGIREDAGGIVVGAMTRQQEVLTSDVVAARIPELAVAVRKTGHRGTRNWGTVGGSVANADPTGEIPAATVALEAEMVLASASGERTVPASHFYTDSYVADLRAGEVLVAVRFPRRIEFTSAAFEEVSRRRDDFAIAGAFACLRMAGTTVEASRIAVTGGGPTPLRLPEVEAALAGRVIDRVLLDEVDAVTRDAIDPPDHLWASSDYRRQLVAVTTRRAISAAASQPPVAAGVEEGPHR